MNKTHKVTRKGFTLLEILLVIAAIGILAAIVLVAINPNRQIAQARNAERRADINTIYKALEQYLIDNQSYPAGIGNTVRDICKTGVEPSGSTSINCNGKVDLRPLVPTYIAGIPEDPAGGEYKVNINQCNNRISVVAPDAQLSQSISINPPSPLGINYSTTNFNTGVATTINPTVSSCSGTTITYSVTAGTLPPGITLNSNTGALTTTGVSGSSNGTLDTTFNPGTGANSSVESSAIQSDGKIIIGGTFTTINGISRNSIARLNIDGTLDTAFNPGTGANNNIDSIVVQDDGKIIIGGTFTSFNETISNRIARLNTNGSLDTNFNPGTGANGNVASITIQSNGKVLIGGGFDKINNISLKGIARLNSDGSLDTNFNPGTGADNTVRSVVVQSDGKVLIGGQFISFNGITRNRIARLNSDGSLDTDFNPGTGADNRISSVVLQSDGKVLIGGQFTSFNGFNRNYITRLNTNGTLDTSFNIGTGANNDVISVVVQDDGKILVGGSFSAFNGISRNRITRLNYDGSLDTNFNPGNAANNSVSILSIKPSGIIFMGGAFTNFNGVTINRIAQLGGITIPGFPSNITIQASSTSGETASQNLTLTVNQ